LKPFPLFIAVGFASLLIFVILPHLSRSRLTQAGPALALAETGASAYATGFSSTSAPGAGSAIASYPGLTEFAAGLVNGRADEVVGVYVPEVFALRVEQQPAGRPDYVSDENARVTQFELPKKHGVVGLLAHNYLSGKEFFQLAAGQTVVLVYGDGRLAHFRVTGSLSVQALAPYSPFSQFVDLARPEDGALSSAELFERVYTTGDTLVFQTCIEAEGEPSWGRIFITARPAEPLQLNLPAFAPQTSRN